MRAAPLLIAACLFLAAAPAAAAEKLRAGGLDASDYPTLRVSVVTPTPSGTAPVLRENGGPVTGFQAENLARAKSVVLAIDRSQSMRGQPMQDASEAARAFLSAKPPNDRIAIMAVGSNPVRLTNFSTSTIDGDGALRVVDVDGKYGTALWDSVVLSSTMLGAESLPGRVLILLTDGQEVSSKATLEKAIDSARAAGVAVYVVGIESEKFQPEPLQRLAASTGGTYYGAATSDALTSIYASIAEELRRTWRLTYLTAGRPGESVTIRASLTGASPATLRAHLPGKESAQGAEGTWMPAFMFEHNVAAFLLALLAGGTVIAAAALTLTTPGGDRLRRRLEPHVADVHRARGPGNGSRAPFDAAAGVMKATEKSLAHLKIWESLTRLIERADLPLRTVELFYASLGGGILLGLLFTAAGMASLVVLGAAALGASAPVLFVSFKAKRRLAGIENQLPDLLITIAASLKAGHSFRQGIQAVVDEGQPPAADEFKRVLTETSLGRSMDDALDDMAARVGSKNLDFVITAVTIQRQVGGSMAGIFDMVADAVRQRQQFARKIKGLTAMGRMSAYTLVALPIFLAIVLTLINPEYMYPLWHTSKGHQLIMIGVVMMSIGTVILKKIVSFRG